MVKSDPTKDPEFEKVVRTFLQTKPTHHNEKPTRPRAVTDKPKRPARKPTDGSDVQSSS